MESALGLFPLNTVLLPGAAIRLHIFEDRYKEMIGDCIAQHQPFGVLLARNGSEVGAALDPVEIGTSAEIREVTKLPQGRLYIVAHGARRFRIRRVLATQPFWRADVAYLNEAMGPADSARRLRETAQDHFKDYLQALLAVSDAELEDLSLPPDAAASSYVIADALQVDLMVKQRLLEASTAAERLAAELKVLEHETRRLRARRAAAPAQRHAKPTPFNVKFSAN